LSGIYIHIPFCKQACSYCNFHFSTSIKNKEALLSALQKEVILRRAYIGDELVQTIYLGGGTPSLLTTGEIDDLLNTLHASFEIDSNAEITLEANPDDIVGNANWVKDLRSVGVNRLSIGIQSFSDTDLKFMNRAHNAKEAGESVNICKEAGFDNISIDLIYGTPTMSNNQWEENIAKAVSLEVQHISSYGLIVEPKTVLEKGIRTGKIPAVDEEQTAEQFDMIMQKLGDHGFQHYEIASFCVEGFMAVHNSNYWKGENYLGLGPSAHSFNGTSRQWNVSNNNHYINALEKGELNHTIEELTTDQRFNEYIMTSLRTSWGVDLSKISSDFGEAYSNYFLREAQRYIANGDLIHKNSSIITSSSGKLIVDKIASDLFQV